MNYPKRPRVELLPTPRQAPLRPKASARFAVKSNRFLITLNLAKRIESFIVHVARFKHLGISQRELKGFLCARACENGLMEELDQ